MSLPVARVAVIVPCYNYGHFLAESLSSLQSQTYPLWECVIVDDGSTDATREVAAALMSRDDRFTYLRQKRGGPSRARNAGLATTSGEYIQFLDADDRLEPDKLRAHVDYLERHPDVGIVYGDAVTFGPERDDRVVSPLALGGPVGSGSGTIDRFVVGNPLVVEAPLVRRTVVDGVGMFSEGLFSLEDWDLWTRCAVAGVTFARHAPPGTEALVRLHPTSMSRDPRRMLAPTVEARRRFARLALPASARAMNERYLGRARVRLALLELSQGRVGNTVLGLMRAVPHLTRARLYAWGRGVHPPSASGA